MNHVYSLKMRFGDNNLAFLFFNILLTVHLNIFIY